MITYMARTNNNVATRLYWHRKPFIAVKTKVLILSYAVLVLVKDRDNSISIPSDLQ